jgi:hypothetical protein
VGAKVEFWPAVSYTSDSKLKLQDMFVYKSVVLRREVRKPRRSLRDEVDYEKTEVLAGWVEATSLQP